MQATGNATQQKANKQATTYAMNIRTKSKPKDDQAAIKQSKSHKHHNQANENAKSKPDANQEQASSKQARNSKARHKQSKQKLRARRTRGPIRPARDANASLGTYSRWRGQRLQLLAALACSLSNCQYWQRSAARASIDSATKQICLAVRNAPPTLRQQQMRPSQRLEMRSGRGPAADRPSYFVSLTNKSSKCSHVSAAS